MAQRVVGTYKSSRSRSELQNRKLVFFENRKLKISEPEVEKYLIRKLVGFCYESLIFVFLISQSWWSLESFLSGYVYILFHRERKFLKVSGASHGQNISDFRFRYF